MKDKTKNNQSILSAIKKLEKSLRSEFQRGFKNLDSKFSNKLKDTEFALMIGIEERAEKMEETLREEIRAGRDDLMTKIDSFAGKTKALEDENTVGAHQTRELEVKVEDHETRITKIESPPQSA